MKQPGFIFALDLADEPGKNLVVIALGGTSSSVMVLIAALNDQFQVAFDNLSLPA